MKLSKNYCIYTVLLFLTSQAATSQNLYKIDIVFSGKNVSKKSIGTLVYHGFQSTPLKKSSDLISEEVSLQAKYPVVEISYFSSKHSPSFHRFFLSTQKCRLEVQYDEYEDVITVVNTSGVISFEDGGLRYPTD